MMNPRIPTGLALLAVCALHAPIFAQAEPAPAPPAETTPAEAEKKPDPNSPEYKAQLAADTITLEKMAMLAEADILSLEARIARIDADRERSRLDAENALAEAKLASQADDEEERRAALEFSASIASLKSELELAEKTARLAELELAAKLRKQETSNAVVRIETAAERTRKLAEADKILITPRVYPADPVENGVLRISDRRIDIEFLITSSNVTTVIDKINFFNLRDPKAPIFLVFENCWGASAMATTQMLTAIESSSAPVHAVVKSSCSGAASAIVAAAAKSYTIRNARLSFNRPFGRSYGSPEDQNDQLAMAKKWYARTHARIAAKIGLTPEKFTEAMYDHNSNGYWLEFGDKAVSLKWVDTLVEGFSDDSVAKLADKKNQETYYYEKKTDALPPLSAGDIWMIHGPEKRLLSR